MANTIIGSSIVIDGEITGDEDLVIQGTVKGKIQLKESLYVEASGVVEADIETQNVEVSGQVTGNVAASDKVELKSQCRMIGDIKAPRILIVDGARFRGAVDMGDLDTPRATGELPPRTVSTTTSLTRSSSAPSSIPARRPMPSVPVRSSGGPVRPASSTPARPSAPIQARPASSDDTTSIGGRSAPVLAGKKLKKKVVVRKKV